MSKFIELANIVKKSIAEEMQSVHTKQIIRNEGERFYLIDQSAEDKSRKLTLE